MLAPQTVLMASKRSRSRIRWLQHRTLIKGEAVLVVGLLREVAAQWIAAQPSSVLPNWGKVMFTMAATIGLFGGLFYVLESFTAKSVAKTHQAVQALPLPTPYLLVHAGVFAALFFAYARVMHLPPW